MERKSCGVERCSLRVAADRKRAALQISAAAGDWGFLVWHAATLTDVTPESTVGQQTATQDAGMIFCISVRTDSGQRSSTARPQLWLATAGQKPQTCRAASQPDQSRSRTLLVAICAKHALRRGSW